MNKYLEQEKQKAFDEICSLGSLPCKGCFDDGFDTGVIAGIRYGFEKGRELVDDGLKDAPIEMQIIFKKISEQAAKDILEGLKYKSAEEVIKELDDGKV